ncbi:MAG: hypothetical protein ACRCVX_02270 [Shewanella sp.]
MAKSHFTAIHGGTVEVMYIGPKSVKTDTVTGYRPQLRFPRLEPVPVPEVIAQTLFAYPDVWIPCTDENINAVKSSDAALLEAQAKSEAEAEAMQKAEEDDADTMVNVDGEQVDLGKYTFPQLATFSEAHDLNVTREPEEPKPELVKRIRDAYRAKSSE